VTKTLLAVDDSATMRKVLEITFAGEDFRVVAADGRSSALAKMGEEPVAALIDTSLDGDDGYAIAKEVRARDATVAIVLMASRYNPYDANRGRDAGVDDYIDKPFDTQALIDKVKKALASREGAKAAQQVPTVQPAAAAPAPSPAPPIAASPRPPQVSPASPGSQGSGRPAWPVQRSHTLSFEGGPSPSPSPPGSRGPQPPVRHEPSPAAALSRTQPTGMPIIHPPAAPSHGPTHTPLSAGAVQRPQAPPAHQPPPPPAPVAVQPPEAIAVAAAAVNGQLAGKLGELGLTAQQAEAVIALSREVVERVVWEVVPQLAEAIIKEEIARLTKEG
jgi:CheY-like chemotaxis protein